jgi:3D (Asp-Asp-Asp) domain-containing protein
MRLAAAVLLAASVAPAGAAVADKGGRISLTVTATAYNSTDTQTDDTPHHGAWGDALDEAVKPGLRVIAVSPDLLEKGLKRGQRVRIRGLKGEFIVLDKMPARWTRRIDIYMQKDVRAARRWGRRRVKLSWTQAP